MDKSPPIAPMMSVLRSILNRYNVQLFTKLILHSRQEEDSSVTIRHYDQECESAITMVDVIQTALQRKKIQALMTLKLLARPPRFIRSHTPRRPNSVQNKTSYFRRKDNQQITTRTQRSSSFRKMDKKEQDANREQMKEIFDKVRNIAIHSLEKTPKKYSPYARKSNVSMNDEYTRRKNSFLHKLSQLQADFSQLVETQKKLGKAEDTPVRKRPSFREKGRQIRMIDINFC